MINYEICLNDDFEPIKDGISTDYVVNLNIEDCWEHFNINEITEFDCLFFNYNARDMYSNNWYCEQRGWREPYFKMQHSNADYIIETVRIYDAIRKWLEENIIQKNIDNYQNLYKK